MVRFAVLLVMVLACSSPAIAVDRWVTTGGTDSGDCSSDASPCLTIQYALEQAGNGDWIKIAEGTSYGPVDFHPKGAISGLHISGGWNCASLPCTGGSGNPGATVIDATGGFGMRIGTIPTGTLIDVTVENLSIKYASSGGVLVGGGGSVTFTIADCILEGNSHAGYLGGAIYVGSQDVRANILRNTIRNNTAGEGGGVGVSCNGTVVGQTVNIQGNIFQGNMANNGGGAFIISTYNGSCSPKVTLSSNLIGPDPNTGLPSQANVALWGGGGSVFAGGGKIDVTVIENTINGNSATNEGAGIHVWNFLGEIDIKASGNKFLSNGDSALLRGGGFYAEAGGGTIIGEFSENTVEGNDAVKGAGFYLKTGALGVADYRFRGNTIVGNGSSQSGGAAVGVNNVGGGHSWVFLFGDRIGNNRSGLDVVSADLLSDVYLRTENVFLVDNDVWGAAMTSGSGGGVGFYLLNTTVAGNGMDPFASATAGLRIASTSGGTTSGTIVNSIAFGNDLDIILVDAPDDSSVTDVEARYSAWNSLDDIELVGPTSVFTDGGGNEHLYPMFVDSANGDYRLESTSPLVDAAFCEFGGMRIAPFRDFDGDPRPPTPEYGLLCDMGADEIDHCTNGLQDTFVDPTGVPWETGVDCGGSRCVPCGCTVGTPHARMACGLAGEVAYADVATAYGSLANGNGCTIRSHTMEFNGNHLFTTSTGNHAALTVTLSGGWPCGWGSFKGSPAYSTVRGKVVVGGDTTIVADGLAVW